MRMKTGFAKQLLSILLCVTMLLTYVPTAAFAAEGTADSATLYLVPNEWTSDNAGLAVYYWTGTGNNWVKMEKVQDNLYKTVTPIPTSGLSGVIFVRHNSAQEPSWDSKWNQTADLTFSGTQNTATIPTGGWEGTAVTWSHTHLGGTATCSEKAVCESCGEGYGDLNSDNHIYDAEGKCDCGLVCSHSSANTSDYTCTTCGNRLAAKWEKYTSSTLRGYKYYLTLDAVELTDTSSQDMFIILNDSVLTGTLNIGWCTFSNVNGATLTIQGDSLLSSENSTGSYDWILCEASSMRAAGTQSFGSVETLLNNGLSVLLRQDKTVGNLSVNVFFKVPAGRTLTVNGTLTLGESAILQIVGTLAFGEAGRIVNSGTVQLPEGTSYAEIPAAITGGIVKIGTASYTWDNDQAKWICDESSHVGGIATCKERAHCSLCKQVYGYTDSTNHASTELTYTDNGDGTHLKAHACCGLSVNRRETHFFDSTTGKCACGYEMAGAKVTSGGVDTYHETLSAALAAAVSGDTVSLCADVDIKTTSHTIPEGVTFSGGEYTISGEGAGWVYNNGIITDGKFTFLLDNRGTIKGGEFFSVSNSGAVMGGSFQGVDCKSGSSISGPVRISDLTYIEECSINLSEAYLTSGVRIINASAQGLPVSSLHLPEGYALQVDDSIVSVLPPWLNGFVVEHAHTYEKEEFDTSNHWMVCACGAATEKLGHSYTYAPNGENHTVGCVGCGYTGTGDHTMNSNTGKCGLCEAVVAAAKVTTSGGRTTYYETLPAAVTAAQSSSNSTVTLLKDIDLGGKDLEITSGKFTIDLNDCTCTNGDYWNIDIQGGTLTITDSGPNQTGKIMNGDAFYGVTVNPSGTLNLIGGTIEGLSGIRMIGGTVNISGGTVIGTSSSEVEGALNANGSSSINITGGSISGKEWDLYFTSNCSVKLMVENGKAVGATFPGGLTINRANLNDLLDIGCRYWAVVDGKDTMLTVADDVTRITDKGDITVKAACAHPENSRTDYTTLEEGKHSYLCALCSNTFTEDHTVQSEATCIAKAVCKFCGEYGVKDATNHADTAPYDNGFCLGCDIYEPAVDSDNDGYYEISNAGQLYWFAQQVNAGNNAINGKLMKDIVVNAGTMTAETTGAREWIPISKDYSNGYSGTFEGNNKTISGLYLNNNELTHAGLFGHIDTDGKVQNVGVINSYIKDSNSLAYVGGISSYNHGAVLNCYNTGRVIGNLRGGGVVGYNHGTVTDCYNEGDVSGTSSIGGVVGSNRGTVTDCYNKGSINGSQVGGVVGNNTGDVTNCYNTGDVSSTGNNVGGVAGTNDGDVTSCYNTGTVNGTSNIGGVAGNNTSNVTNCYNTGSVSAYDNVGGVVGLHEGSVTSCYNIGTVSGTSNIGGVAGVNDGTVRGCYYLVGCGGTGYGNSRKEEAFKSGEVAYLLGEAFGQTISSQDYPVLGGQKVYYGYLSCTDDAKVYTNNANASATMPEHTGEATYTPKADNDIYTHDVAWSCCGTVVTEYCGTAIYTVSSDGATCTVTCEDCKQILASCTIVAPTCTVYGDGKSCEATVLVDGEPVEDSVDFTYYQQVNDRWSKLEAAPTDAGTYRAEFVVFDDTYYDEHDAIIHVEYTIEKKELTATVSGSMSKSYDGTNVVPQGHSLKIVLDGVISGDTVTASADFAFAGINAGTTTINATNIALSGKDAENYKLKETEVSANVGEIVPLDFNYLEPHDYEIVFGAEPIVYNGKEQAMTVESFVMCGMDVTYELNGNTGTEAGFYTMTVTATGNFAGTVTQGWQISKKAVTVTAKDQTITYGSTISDTEFTSAGLADGHSVTVTLMPSTANVTADGTITASAAVIAAGSTDVTANYEITYAGGKLVIEPDTSKIAGLTTENVTSANETDIKEVQEMMANADSVKDEWKAISDTCEDMIDRIEEVETAKKEATDKADTFDADTVKSTDQEALEQLAEEIEALLDTENLTEDERKALEEVQAQVAGMLDTVVDTAEDSKAAADVIDALDPETVTSEDKEELEQAIETIDELLKDDHLTEEERKALTDAKAEAETLIGKIDAAADATDTENTDKVENVTAENVKPENKEDLEDAKADLEKALEANGGNYTESEKKTIQEQIDRIEAAVAALENVEKVTESIGVLPESVETDDEAAAEKILSVKEAYDALTDHEKSLVDEDVKKKLDALVAVLTAYDIIEGDGSSWTQGSNTALSFTANGAFSKFVGIKVGGKNVDKANYEAKSGSTVITLKTSYLDTLAAGEYTLTVVYTNGSTDGTFKIAAKATTPPTGDSSNIMLFGSMLTISLAGLIVLLWAARKRKPENA